MRQIKRFFQGEWVWQAATAVALLACLVFAPAPGGGLADRYRILDAALSMLEEGNPFLLRYNEINGTEIQAKCPLGCPYFWGGRSVKKLLTPASPSQSSDYYHTDRQYLYGLDCVGLTRWAVQQVGYAPHDAISNLLNRSMYQEYAVYKAAKVTGKERTAALRVGDLLAIQHPSGGFHIAMFIGTLWDFGYTAAALPEKLAPYLYYPLLIHCTGSNDYYSRYRAYLEAAAPDSGILPPFGGVIVSLLDAPAATAPSRTPEGPEPGAPCFVLEGYNLQVTDLAAEKRFRWIRWRQRPE